MKFRLMAAVYTFVLLMASTAHAQFETGAVLGTVKDTSGAVLPGVRVTLLNMDTGIQAVRTTDERGGYEFFTVRVGTYKVSAELQGFSTRDVPNVKVDVGARQRVDVELAVGAMAESISVQAASPLIETDSSQRGQLISGEQTRAGEQVTFVYTPATAFQVSGIAQDFRGANNYRPNVAGDPYAPEGQQAITNWFNKANVTIPTDPSHPFGNAARNSVRGPGFWQIDAVASKQFDLTGASRIEFRLEAFNVLNRTNFRAPNGNVSQASFGQITSTYDARQLQLGVKLIW